MSIVLERFGTTMLPILAATQDIGTAGSRSVLLSLPGGGAYDTYSDEIAPRQSQTLRARGVLVGLPSERQVQFDALRALRGRRDKLYARQDDTTVRWTWARVLAVAAQNTIQQVNHQEVDLSIEIAHPIWYGNQHGAGWVFDAGEMFDSGVAFDQALGDSFTLDHLAPTQFSLTNAGTAPVTNAVITVTPGSAAITGFTLATIFDAAQYTDLIYSGSLAVGARLTIDAGAQAAYILTGVSALAAAAATTISVLSSAGFVVGRDVEIVLDNGGIHRTTIATVPTGASFTIADPLPSSSHPFNDVRMNAYTDLSFGPLHRSTEWLPIFPPSTLVDMTITSTQDGTIAFAYSDGFE